MRILFWFVLLAVAAAAVALAIRLNAGYALLVAPPYRIELSLNLFLLLLLGGFAAIYVTLRLITRAVRLPSSVRTWRRQQKRERARAKQDAAIVALLEGRYRSAGHSRLCRPLGDGRRARSHRRSRFRCGLVVA